MDLIPILFIYLTEAETYCSLLSIFHHQRLKQKVLEEQLLRRLQTNYSVDVALVRTFKKAFAHRYGSFASHMESVQAYDDHFFLLTFTRLFRNILPLNVVLRLLDSFLVEGPKVFCRLMMAILKIHRKEMKACTSMGSEWWTTLQKRCYDSSMNYDHLFKITFRWRYAHRFKRSKMKAVFMLVRQDQDLQARAACFGQHHPLEVLDATDIKLLQPQRDYYFRSWLPPTIQTRKMKLLYSTERHGRSLDTLYHLAGTCNVKMLLLVEVISREGDGVGSSDVIGAFVSEPIVRHASFFGNSQCFVFRLQPFPQRFKSPLNCEDISNCISPTSTARTSILAPLPSPARQPNRQSRQSRTSRTTSMISEDETHQLNGTFVLARPEFLSIGVNPHSSAAALRLNNDLTYGSSEATEIFDNPALVENVEFEIGIIELYGFVYG